MRPLVYTAFVFGLAFTATSAVAQPICMKRADIVNHLANKYKEAATGMGLVGGSQIVEIYVSEKGTFSILTSYPNGVACIVAAGDNWETLKPPPQKLTAM